MTQSEFIERVNAPQGGRIIEKILINGLVGVDEVEDLKRSFLDLLADHPDLVAIDLGVAIALLTSQGFELTDAIDNIDRVVTKLGGRLKGNSLLVALQNLKESNGEKQEFFSRLAIARTVLALLQNEGANYQKYCEAFAE